jgi:hypothetical protein
MVLVGLGLLGPGVRGGTLLVPAAIGVGFFVGGLFVGLRWSDAPVLHGAAITFLSVLVWFLGEVLTPRFMEPALGSGASRSEFALGMILLQLVVTVAGGLTGRRMVLGRLAAGE